MTKLSFSKLHGLALTLALAGLAHVPALVAGCGGECVREIYCVKQCGDPPIDYGCGACPSDMIELINCPLEAGGSCGECPNHEIECTEACGMPSVEASCCPCPTGTVDVSTCPSDAGADGG